jgi:hypothetical protein
MENQKIYKIVPIYSIIVSLIFAMIFWIVANHSIYSVSIPALRGILLILVAAIVVGILARLFVTLGKTENVSSGRIIFNGLLGGILVGIIGGGLSGLIWGILLNVVSKANYWDSLTVFGGFFLLYGGVVGLIFGTIGYPIIVRTVNQNTNNSIKEG